MFNEYIKIFENKTSGWIFWNFRTSSDSYSWNYLSAYKNKYIQLNEKYIDDEINYNQVTYKNNKYINIAIINIILIIIILTYLLIKCLILKYRHRSFNHIIINTNNQKSIFEFVLFHKKINEYIPIKQNDTNYGSNKNNINYGSNKNNINYGSNKIEELNI
jgi:hypothetical protein